MCQSLISISMLSWTHILWLNYIKRISSYFKDFITQENNQFYINIIYISVHRSSLNAQNKWAIKGLFSMVTLLLYYLWSTDASCRVEVNETANLVHFFLPKVGISERKVILLLLKLVPPISCGETSTVTDSTAICLSIFRFKVKRETH